MNSKFLHLHTHTEYSIISGVSPISDIVDKAKKFNMPAVAITDISNLFATIKFYKNCISEGIKPIIGAELLLENTESQSNPFRIVMLCQNNSGYRNLTKIISDAYTKGQINDIPIVKKSELLNYNNGLIVLSGMHSDIGSAVRSKNDDKTKNLIEWWMKLFENRFYFEISRIGHAQEDQYIDNIFDISVEFNLPIVATNDMYFIHQNDFDIHEARVCINQGRLLNDQKRPKEFSQQQYFRSSEEMCDLFSDIPEAIENTINIAKRCNLKIDLEETHLPNFTIPLNQTIEEYFDEQSKIGLENRFSVMFDSSSQDYQKQREIYDERIKIELSVIKKMGFAGYFLIVADFIQWAKNHDIPVGPGRGSGAGSIVAYALKITDVDPLIHGLLFERFLNPERISMPDFDIDFCMDGRDRVIEYVSDKYGSESVAQIITFGTMAAKAVIRDVGRVLGHNYGFTDSIAKLIPFELGITLKKALEQDELLSERYKNDDEVRYLIDFAKRLEGTIRNVGKHAGGVVIAPSKLTDFTALYCESDGSNLVTQFDKDDIETVGLVKFDFLGLRTLTIIQWAVNAINKTLEKENHIDISLLQLDDKKTFDLIKSGHTTAMFQIESRSMKELIKRLQPDKFEDIVALVALCRPGPLQSGMVDDFINRRHGRAQVEYPHQMIADILKPTYGVIVYQEQVMQIAQVLSGYSLGEADLLRRAMGKKKQEEMEKQREKFVNGAIKNGVAQDLAGFIFDLIEKFSGYGFNKSHSVAYAMITYQTAWLKAHYPAEFMAAVLSSDMDNTDKMVKFIDDCKSLGITVLNPDVNSSEIKFKAINGSILFGLKAIKGVGDAGLENIIQNRNKNGPFIDFVDFITRIDLKKANKRVLEALAKSGALDKLGQHRAAMCEIVPIAIEAIDQKNKKQSFGQLDLFSKLAGEKNVYTPDYSKIKPWTKHEILEAEKEVLGFYYSGHPINEYDSELKSLITGKLGSIKFKTSKSITIAGLVTSIKKMNTKRGDQMVFIRLDDGTGQIEITVFSDVYKQCREILINNALLIIEGQANVDEYTDTFRIIANKVFNILQARTTLAKYIQIIITNDCKNSEILIPQLSSILLKNTQNGTLPIHIKYERPDSTTTIPLGNKWNVVPTDNLLEELKNIFMSKNVNIIY